ncbi:uncharacterized protein CMU_014770 [Cryptosporidium muris RN66]|uniref:Uncharacterized protein n=2 Tax=Cryptosporidium TaxID=5806 RepID=B6AF34_CRYMR|nr:uncharacterized protein CMU_014770 [Cryptosporidium muris RN66]EEA06801.1 hypothetical protein, conserved [Cryptosporidium muris RN66]OII72315.1 hypothetical protein cand_012650 [Cryptosporidium andersoni]|eukprot:XP_002141150.1 hypothetical protein [Cryptosporidium muris RN66]
MDDTSDSRPEIWQLSSISSGYRELFLGTSKLAMVLCTNLHLSPGTTITAFYYIYKFWSKFDALETDRRFIASAAVLLAWKVREDVEPSRSSRKLSELSRFLYRILKANTLAQNSNNASSLDISSSLWIYKDSGKEYSNYMEQIKTYEFALLRAINFELTPIELPFNHIERLTRLLLYSPMAKEEGEDEDREYQSLKMFRLLSMSICMDLYRLPNVCMQYNALEISLCSVWFAGIFLSLPFAYEGVDKSSKMLWISKVAPNINQNNLSRCMNESGKILLWLVDSDSS